MSPEVKTAQVSVLEIRIRRLPRNNEMSRNLREN
jgi:hypothetical protein